MNRCELCKYKVDPSGGTCPTCGVPHFTSLEERGLESSKSHSKRTNCQNRSLHLFYELLATELNAAGLDMRATLKPSVSIDWTPETVKEYLWRPVQKLQLQKESTTELSTDEVSKVYETINRHLGEKHGLHVPFPERLPEA